MLNNTASKIKLILFCVFLAILHPIILFADTTAQSTAEEVTDQSRMTQFVDSLLAEMTLEEKCGQLVQYRWPWGKDTEETRNTYRTYIKNGRVGSFLGIHGVENTQELQRLAVEESRLGIPLLFAHDIIHGFRTVTPVPLAEASSWNPRIVEQSARMAAIEATAAGLHWTFAPMVDITREPRWGRVVEGSGEDPFLGSVMAAARVRGFQGNDMLACAKHFAAYGGAEGGRDYNTVDISDRTLREIYLPPFHAAVKAGVGSIMGAFNEIGGIPMHANHFLITDLLRSEWGFDGIFISDFTAIQELQPHGVAATPSEAGLLAINAGVNIDMVSGIYIKELPDLVRSEQLSESIVDVAVRPVLEAKYKLGLFDDPFRYHDVDRERGRIYTEGHLSFAREIARESIVLLKNKKQLLPLRKDISTMAIIGALAKDQDAPLGSWRGAGRSDDVVTVWEGIQKAVSSQTKLMYADGYNLQNFDDDSGFDEALEVARQADVVVLVLGETAWMSGEASNRSQISLPGKQEALAKAIQATGKPIIAVLMNGRPLAISWLADNIPAILETWFLGVRMGHAVGDILFGDVNPGGKLPMTFPRAVGQIPIYYNHKNTGRPPDNDDYYTSKYLDLPSSPLYPFGYGLSYTSFDYSAPQLSAAKISKDDTLTVNVEVTNSGNRSGDEVIQLYVRDEVGSVTRPVKQLRGFQRVSLSPGERKLITFSITAEDLAFYDLNMNKVVEPGTFRVFVGTSSQDVTEAGFEVIEE